MPCVLQIHGWPDLSLGWRYQIPLLLSLGLRVVAPDMMGYGGTVRISKPLPPPPHPLNQKSRLVMRKRSHVLTCVCVIGRPPRPPKPHKPLRPQTRIRRHRRPSERSKRTANHPGRT